MPTSKIARKTFYQFGTTANPASEIGQFGSFVAPDFSFDVEVMQSGTAWPRGWFGSVQNNNRQFIQDQNAVDFVFSYMIAVILQMGIPDYDNATLYTNNSITQVAGQIYISLQDNNVGNPPGTSPTWWQSGLPGAEITGAVKQYAGIVAPAGYLFCQGQAVSRSTYAALFNICGTAFGVGDGSTTFNVPNLQGNVAVGLNAGDPNFGIMGQVGGEVTHVLKVSEMPAHSHNVLGDAAHYSSPPGSGDPYGQGAFNQYSWNTGNTGGGAAHNNLQPFIVLNYIIKT